MSCRIELRGKSRRTIRKLPSNVVTEIEEKFKELSTKPICEKKLRVRLKEFCRARVGSYRIVYNLYPVGLSLSI